MSAVLSSKSSSKGGGALIFLHCYPPGLPETCILINALKEGCLGKLGSIMVKGEWVNGPTEKSLVYSSLLVSCYGKLLAARQDMFINFSWLCYNKNNIIHRRMVLDLESALIDLLKVGFLSSAFLIKKETMSSCLHLHLSNLSGFQTFINLFLEYWELSFEKLDIIIDYTWC